MHEAVFLFLYFLLALPLGARCNVRDDYFATASMGTKTKYANRIVPQPAYAFVNVSSNQSCVAKEFKSKRRCENVTFVYFIGRHGSRFPTKRVMKSLLSAGLDLQIHENDAGLLTHVGIAELHELGRRFRARYADTHAFPSELIYHPLQYDFRSSQVTRALQSAYAFAAGLFENSTGADQRPPAIAIQSENKFADRLLRFHKICEGYQEKVKQNKTLRENGVLGSLKKKVAKEVVSILENRHSSFLQYLPVKADTFTAEASVEKKFEAIRLLWEACKFEVILMKNKPFSETRFCSIFFEDREFTSLLEYMDDAEAYWLKGPGFSLNSNMSCHLTEEIIRLASEANKDSPIRGAFRFAHAETLIPLITKLKIFNDDSHIFTASASMDSEVVKKRSWKMSSLSPMASNIILEFHTCTAPNFPDPHLYVRLLLNEKPYSLCEEPDPETLCPASALTQLLSPVPCDWDKLCAP